MMISFSLRCWRLFASHIDVRRRKRLYHFLRRVDGFEGRGLPYRRRRMLTLLISREAAYRQWWSAHTLSLAGITQRQRTYRFSSRPRARHLHAIFLAFMKDIYFSPAPNNASHSPITDISHSRVWSTTSAAAIYAKVQLSFHALMEPDAIMRFRGRTAYVAAWDTYKANNLQYRYLP